MSDHPSPLFFGGCIAAIREMRQYGMNEMIVGCVLSEVRAAAIAEERQRVDELRSKNPPEHFPAQNFAQYIERWMPADRSAKSES